MRIFAPLFIRDLPCWQAFCIVLTACSDHWKKNRRYSLLVLLSFFSLVHFLQPFPKLQSLETSADSFQSLMRLLTRVTESNLLGDIRKRRASLRCSETLSGTFRLFQ